MNISVMLYLAASPENWQFLLQNVLRVYKYITGTESWITGKLQRIFPGTSMADFKG